MSQRPDRNNRGKEAMPALPLHHKIMKKTNPIFLEYDGIYHKITRHDLECGCFCSVASCDEEFFVDQIVIETHNSLYHIKCMGEGYNIKKPEFEDANGISG
jgi:hypothetical protein